MVFADGVARYKPLLMFKGKDRRETYARKEERRKYYPSVIVWFNEKAYANTSNLITYFKTQYAPASAYPLRDHEPRLLVLNTFALHKSKGRVPAKKKESEA